MRTSAGGDWFAVGAYWSPDLQRLLKYLEEVGDSMSLFDVPLHFAFLSAATSNGNFDMGSIFRDSLVKVRPDRAVTFVDNHDTQPGQALVSFIPAWFKPIAYALILLRADGIPCVFYGDYYGIPHDGIAPVSGLRALLKLRKDWAYGEQRDYFDDSSLVGFVRLGDEEHPNSGMAVLMTDSVAGKKRMEMGSRFAGAALYDALGRFSEPVILDEDGAGEFPVQGGSVSVWVLEPVYRAICTQIEF